MPPKSQKKPASKPGQAASTSEVDTVANQRVAAIMNSFKELRLDDNSADITIYSGGREFRAHRSVLCTQSSFFNRAFSGAFLEAQTNSIELPEDYPEIMDRFLQYLYTGTYDDGLSPTPGKPDQRSLLSPEEVSAQLRRGEGVPVGTAPFGTAPEEYAGSEDGSHTSESTAEDDDEPEDDDGDDTVYKEAADLNEEQAWKHGHLSMAGFRDPDNLYLHLRLYVIADKYDVPPLKLLARHRFYRAAEMTWQDSECFPDLVDELYCTTLSSDTGLREIVCRLVGAAHDDKAQRERMGDVMAKHREFAKGVLDYVAETRKDN